MVLTETNVACCRFLAVDSGAAGGAESGRAGPRERLVTIPSGRAGPSGRLVTVPAVTHAANRPSLSAQRDIDATAPAIKPRAGRLTGRRLLRCRFRSVARRYRPTVERPLAAVGLL